MEKLVSLNHTSSGEDNSREQPKSKGLAPVICYEPWFPRALESVKQCINDGYPILVRLHSAASYPIQTSERYEIDLESHAVLIVGYDDDKQAVALIDPWNNNWGGVLGGRRWLSYASLQIMSVNCTCDKQQNLAPLQLDIQPHFDQGNNLSVDLRIGFYNPKGTIMDRTSWAIKEVAICCILPKHWGGKQVEYAMSGNWLVGDFINASLPLVSSSICEGEVEIIVKATIKGSRPYEFEDVIEISKITNVRHSQINNEKNYFMATV